MVYFSIADYRCIGRTNGFTAILSNTYHDCRNYILCNNQIEQVTPCPANQFYVPAILPTIGACSATGLSLNGLCQRKSQLLQKTKHLP